MDPQAGVMLRKATEDRGALDYEFLSDAIFGFHAQQAFEKLFKALIAFHNVPYERTHILASLLLHLNSLGELAMPLPYGVHALQPFAVLFRYDDGPSIPAQERQEIREAIDVLVAYVTLRLHSPPVSMP